VELALKKPGLIFRGHDIEDNVFIGLDGVSERMTEKCLTNCNEYVIIAKQLDDSQVVEERCLSDSELILQVQGRWQGGGKFCVTTRPVRRRSSYHPEAEMQWEIDRRSEELARLGKQSSWQSDSSVNEGASCTLENVGRASNEEIELCAADSSLKQELIMLEKQLYTEQRLYNGAKRMADLKTDDRQLRRKIRERLEQSKQHLVQLQSQIDLVKANVQLQDLDSNISQA
jgi:hypothetical protein